MARYSRVGTRAIRSPLSGSRRLPLQFRFLRLSLSLRLGITGCRNDGCAGVPTFRRASRTARSRVIFTCVIRGKRERKRKRESRKCNSQFRAPNTLREHLSPSVLSIFSLREIPPSPADTIFRSDEVNLVLLRKRIAASSKPRSTSREMKQLFNNPRCEV